MSRIGQRIQMLGLVFSATAEAAGVLLLFGFVRISGRRALISGHSPQAPDGSFAAPLGKLGRELTVE
jgi:hypothetical protein